MSNSDDAQLESHDEVRTSKCEEVDEEDDEEDDHSLSEFEDCIGGEIADVEDEWTLKLRRRVKKLAEIVESQKTEIEELRQQLARRRKINKTS